MLLQSYRCYTKNYITMVYGTTDVKEEAIVASSLTSVVPYTIVM